MIKEKNGKYYNHANVVMLPTNEKATDKPFSVGITLCNDKKLRIGNPVGTSETRQHLYITFDEEIKVGDWMYSKMDGYPTQWDGDLSETKNPKEYGYNKIIATTDVLPIYKAGIEIDLFIPKLSKEFIEAYTKAYNEGKQITTVEIEYWCGETNCNCATRQQDCFRAKQNQVIKINPDNTINIKPIKDSWSREEVIELINEAIKKGFYLSDCDNNGEYDYRNNNTDLIEGCIENFIKEIFKL